MSPTGGNTGYDVTASWNENISGHRHKVILKRILMQMLFLK